MTPPLQGHRVLVVDDDAAIRDMLALILEDAGATVRTIAHAASVVPYVRSWKPDRILLDWLMEPTSGDVALEALRQAKLVPSIPLIVVSAYLGGLGDAERQHALRHLGARAFLAKPIVDWDAAFALIADPPPLWPGVRA